MGNMDTPASRAKEAWMEPLQPTVRQGVAQLKDFITKLVDIEEKEGEAPRGAPGHPLTFRFAPPLPSVALPTACKSCLCCAPCHHLPLCLFGHTHSPLPPRCLGPLWLCPSLAIIPGLTCCPPSLAQQSWTCSGR